MWAGAEIPCAALLFAVAQQINISGKSIFHQKGTLMFQKTLLGLRATTGVDAEARIDMDKRMDGQPGRRSCGNIGLLFFCSVLPEIS